MIKRRVLAKGALLNEGISLNHVSTALFGPINIGVGIL
jgi:hypothetical protein